jgi:hypothetical protein
MPWSQVGSRRYFYRHLWRDGRSVRQYVGTGQGAELVAALDELRRVERAAEARQRREEQERHQRAEGALIQMCLETDVLASATLVASGYHRHDRGEWRRRRHEPGVGECGSLQAISLRF